MKIKHPGLFFLFLFFQTGLFAQGEDSIVQHGFSVNAFAGIQGFTNSGNIHGLPGPVGGLSFSWYAKTVQVELGVGYYMRSDRYYGLPAYFPGSSPDFKTIDYTQHVLNTHLLVNVKIAQWNRHILSMFMGFYFRKNINWKIDSLLNDDTRRIYDPVVTEANRGIGINITGGFRYTFMCSKKWNIFTSVHAGGNTYSEYQNRTGITDDLRPLEGGFQFGLHLGVQYMLSKYKPRFFAKNT